MSWLSPLDKFKIKDLKITRNGKVVAAQHGKVHRLKVKTKKGTTYLVLKVTKLVRGTLQFTLKATKVGSGAPKVTVVTQVSQR